VAVLGCLALVWGGSCAVFPDEATLPRNGPITSGGETTAAGAGTQTAGSSGVATVVGGAAGEGGAPGAAGEPPVSAGGSGGSGGNEPLAGAAGAAEPTCEQPRDVVVRFEVDTWVEAAKPGAKHGTDALLSIVGGGSERRAMLQLSIPAAPAGALLQRAELELTLSANADASRAARTLAVHRLLREILETRTDWDQFENGSGGEWDAGGGDFGAEVARTTIPAGTASGAISFDVTAAVEALDVSATAKTAGVIVLEVSPPPMAPADLAFVSAEGDAAEAPRLQLHYCQQ
jgi:hypothetical protein